MTEQGKKGTGIKFTPENYEYLKGKGSITAEVNAIVESVRTGKIEVAGHPQGNLSMACIFDLPTVKEGCPVRKKNEFLQKPIHHGDLVRTCGKCPLLDIHKKLEAARELAKMREEARLKAKYPGAFNKPKETTCTPPEDILLKCDTCEASVALSDFADFGNPLLALRNAMLQHVEKAHGRKFLQPEEFPAALVARLKA